VNGMSLTLPTGVGKFLETGGRKNKHPPVRAEQPQERSAAEKKTRRIWDTQSVGSQEEKPAGKKQSRTSFRGESNKSSAARDTVETSDRATKKDQRKQAVLL